MALPKPHPALPSSWGTEDHQNRSRAAREHLSREGAKAPRITPRVDANGHAAPPPPPWFTLVAAIVPALPCFCFLPASTLFIWHPVWVLCFYFLPRPVPQLSPMLVLCLAITFRALSIEGWVNWTSLVPLTAVLGFLMDLAESALWDTLEPFLIGMSGFGAGRRVATQHSKASEPTQRVTAASSIHAGDPARAAAASAFTQTELDALAAQGIKPWGTEARAALKALGW